MITSSESNKKTVNETVSTEEFLFEWQSQYEQKDEEAEKVEVEIVSISPYGNITIGFSKPIIVPPIEIEDFEEQHEQYR